MQQMTFLEDVYPNWHERKPTGNALFDSNSCEWETPQELFDALDAEFHFTLDPCSTDENAKCAKHYTMADNGLLQDWSGETVFCNPPYGRGVDAWCEKCYQHFMGGGYSGHADSGQDGHTVVPRIHLRESRNQVPEGARPVWQCQMERTVPQHDMYMEACEKHGQDLHNKNK